MKPVPCLNCSGYSGASSEATIVLNESLYPFRSDILRFCVTFACEHILTYIYTSKCVYVFVCMSMYVCSLGGMEDNGGN